METLAPSLRRVSFRFRFLSVAALKSLPVYFMQIYNFWDQWAHSVVFRIYSIGKRAWAVLHLNHLMTKPTKWHARPAKTQIRVSAVRMKKPWILSYPLSAQRRLWSDWADVQVDMSLRLVHSHFVDFVTWWLIYNYCSWDSVYISRLMIKPTKWPLRPARTQISLVIRPVWSESSLCA